jgi:hypothetical protein
LAATCSQVGYPAAAVAVSGMVMTASIAAVAWMLMVRVSAPR